MGWNMSALEIQIGGFGGQGVILAGMVIGRGLALYENKHVSLTQSFGPEARGSACSVQLMVDEEPVLFPYVSRPEHLVVLSQEAYRKFAPRIAPGGLLIVEADLVQMEAEKFSVPPDLRIFRVPATRIAEELKRKLVLNMALVGFYTAVSGMLSADSARRAVRESVPAGTEGLNLAAFDKGYAAGLAALAPEPVAV